MRVFELLVYDFSEDCEHLPTTLVTVEEWLSKRPFPLSSQSTVGLRITDGTHELVTESCGRLQETSAGCRAAADRLAAGRLALLRSATDNLGIYLLMSADDPVRVAWIHERPPCGDVFPFSPGRSFDPPDSPQRLLASA